MLCWHTGLLLSERFEKKKVESRINKYAQFMGMQTMVGEKKPGKGGKSGPIRERTIRGWRIIL